MQPLIGVRILDLTRLLPGPFATMVLADLGATVDKVEDPGGGDYLRALPPEVHGQSSIFAALNRGKRSMVLDLKNERGRATFLDLIPRYDVVIEQFRPGVLGRLGLGHDTLRAAHPALIVCALTGYGQTGPMAQRAGHDLNYLARAGLLGFQGPEGGPPQVPGWQLADVSGSLWSVIAILGALAERSRTGQGQVLDIAMVEGVLGFAATAFGALLGGGAPHPGADLLTGGIAPYGTYLSEDGAPISLGALEPKFWASFCQGVGLPFDPAVFVPGPHQAAWKQRVADIFRSRTHRAWQSFSEDHDCCLEPVLRADEVLRDPHLNARGMFFEIETNEGPIGQFRTPVTPHPQDHAFAPPPRPGEHTDAILREAGFSPERIAGLRAGGAVR